MPISNWKHLGGRAVYLALTGEVGAEEHGELARTLDAIAQEGAFETVILDNRDLEVTGRSDEARKAIEELGRTFARTGVKRAVFVASQSQKVPGSEHFIETFEELGGTVEIHPDFASAAKSLGLSYSGPSPMPSTP